MRQINKKSSENIPVSTKSLTVSSGSSKSNDTQSSKKYSKTKSVSSNTEFTADTINLSQNADTDPIQSFLLQKHSSILAKQIIVQTLFRTLNVIYLLFILTLTVPYKNLEILLILTSITLLASVVLNFTWFTETRRNQKEINIIEKAFTTGESIWQDTYINIRYEIGSQRNFDYNMELLLWTLLNVTNLLFKFFSSIHNN